ncbi:hypothetical protein ACGFYQ_34165 [Streptomyces sp. NPDC048258]|uniref:hypothetical protein n=1 Tax=Streptomyces sp. NPDC048258 TaxID=3365527 RepID=UPI003716A4D7
MLNRPAAVAESQDLSRGVQTKVTGRPWNPALHPRDSKGRFIETGGTVRLWGGKLARVVRALPHDRILVQDKVSDGTFSGRRHTTSARWVTMVARPDGSAPTEDENKVAKEDARRQEDPKRGNGVALDDDGDPSTPDEPHDSDDQGRPIGDDDGDGPDDEDDQEEPEDRAHPVKLEALRNRPNVRGARFKDTASVRRHFLELAAKPGQKPEMAAFLRHLAADDDLQLTPSGRYAILRDDNTGRWYLTAVGSGQSIDTAGDFATVEEAGRFAAHLDATARNGHIFPGKFNEPFDFSDPDLDQEARTWRSTQGENIQTAIVRARKEFDASNPSAEPGPATSEQPPAKQPHAATGPRFATLHDVRAHWGTLVESLEAHQDNPRARKVARHLENLMGTKRIKLSGSGQFVVRQNSLGGWELLSTRDGAPMPWGFDRQSDATSFADSFVGTVNGADGTPLDLSDPDFRAKNWRSDDGLTLHQVWTRARAQWDRERLGHDRSPAQQRLAEVMRGEPKETNTPAAPDAAPAAPSNPEAPTPAPETPADEQPQPEPASPELPAGAKPVDGVEGYHYLEDEDGNTVTLYGPDGSVAAVSNDRPRRTTINGVQIPLPGYGVSAVPIMARAHRATQMPPEQRDRVTAEWITFKGKRVMVFRGTDKHNAQDREAIGNVKAMNWSPSAGGWVTMSTLKPQTRDEKIIEVLRNLSNQDRYVLIGDEDRKDNDTPQAPTSDAQPKPSDSPEPRLSEQQKRLRAATQSDLEGQRDNLRSHLIVARTDAQKQRARRDLALVQAELDRRAGEQPTETAPQPEQSPEEVVRALPDAELHSLISAGRHERGMYGRRRGEQPNEQETAEFVERRRRSQIIADDATDLPGLSNEELAEARDTVSRRVDLHSPGGSDDHEAERQTRAALQARLDAIVGEQEQRRADAISSRPPVTELDNDQLEEERTDLAGREFRKAGPEAQRILEGRLEEIKREQREREKRSFTERPAPESLESEALAQEYNELAKAPGTSYQTDDVTQARKDRMAVIAAELNRRDAEGNEQILARVDDLDTDRDMVIDGGAPYGRITYEKHGNGIYKSAGWAFEAGHRSRTGFPSRVAAVAAMVRAYDNDDDRRGERTWGHQRRLFVPKMFFELYADRRLGDRLASASEERRHLYSLFTSRYGWDDGVNPLVAPGAERGRHIKGRYLVIPEGLLAEFHRVTEELSRKVSVQATDRNADSGERRKAKDRLASINVALHAIETAREKVRKDGGDDDRKIISREEIEAQQAALRAALGGDDDEHVQQDGSGSLADAPAAGVGGDGGSGGVRDGEGPGDRGGDSDGRGGAGEDGAGAGGVRSGSGPDQADQGGRDGDGSARTAAGAGGRGGAGAADPGDDGAAGDAGRRVRPVARFRPDPADLPKGPVQRAAGNLDAIRALKKIESEQRPPTERELRALSRWTGWGSVPIIFANEPDEREPRYQQGGARHGKFEADHRRWSEEYRDLRTSLQNELTPLEWRQASRGTLSMHYTPQPIAEAMWEGLEAFGFQGGDVLEAGSGGGTFFGVAPDGARLTGVELDPTSARIARAMYPHANVLNESFAETDAHPGTFDATIGNVPFAAIPFDDKRYPAESLHNGFITKELALTRPGGISILITSRHTLDSKGDKARQQMAKYGDLLGAVRLPSGVFNDAGTGVTTDVLVFRRREDDTEPADTSWLEAPERGINGTPHHVNAYFDEHPEHVLGELTTQSSQYGPQITVKGDPDQAAEQLRSALKEIAAKAIADGRGYEPHPDGQNRPPVQLQAAREKHANDWTGRLYEGDDARFYQHINGADPVLAEPADGRTDQLRALLALRDVAAELRELDRKNDEDERAEKLRAQLRDLHAAYVEKYGPLSKPGQHRTKNDTPTAWGFFRADPDAAAVLALERWDAEKQEPVLSRIFTERAAARRQPLTSTEDPKAALAAVVAATGEVDLDAISRLLNLDPQETLRRLGTEVYTDPATGRLELAGAYTSGAVRDKLEAARKAAERDPAFAVNVAALEAVQPPDRTIGQFTPEMGAHWTPPELVQGFLREYLGDRTLIVAHDDRYGWVLNTGRIPQAVNVMRGVAADPGNETKGRSAVEIARAVLGFGSLTVYKDDKRKDVDEATTRLVRQKADQMRADFARYATANAERLTTLTESYNRIMNGHTTRSYDGMSPTLEGFTPDREPHPWQLSGAARMQFERSVILAHEVGLGKTSTLVMGVQALKASGQIEKPFAVIPNHLAQQWYDEARFLYPNADTHLITSADLADGRRASTLEWLRANKPDLVIFTEEAFSSIKMSPEAQEEYELRELTALREQLDRQYEDADTNHPFIVAKIEARIATVERNMRKNAAPMRRPGETYWNDLGFDYAVIDEAHRYKGVGFRSREGGGDSATIRGLDLHQKLTDLHARRGDRATVTLATGTPLSNSISEQFTMLAFAAPWVLDAYKAGAPDLWAATFGRKILRVENAPDGSGLRVVERFAEFHNKRAMKTMWGLVADTKRGEDVGIPRPKLKGNAPNLVMVEPTKDQQRRLKGLVARGRAIHNGEVDRHQDNMLAVSNEGTSVALDPRLVDANAPAGNKLRAVADKHAERYHQNKDRVYKVSHDSLVNHPVPGALQIIFLNEGTPGGKNKGHFDAYAELRDLMVARGIPAEKIAFVHDHKETGKPEKLAELFRRARVGEISVLIGSSGTMGTGANIQNRAISLTHVDLDWGAAQMEQRNGRILRYGNQNEEVEIDIFATKGSMDGWKAGFVAAKAEGLIDIQRPESADGDSSDTVAEITGAEFDYETMEAEIGGNPFMSQLMKTRRALRDLETDQHNEAAERIRRAEALEELRQEADDTRVGITRREQALPRIRNVRASFTMTLAGSPYSDRSDAGAALHRQITTRLLEHDREGITPWHILGQFGGLDFGVRTERTADGKLLAHVGFPDLRNSAFERKPEDLKSKSAGTGMITRLTNALEKAPALQEADRARVPELDTQIALLQSAHASADLTPQIDHTRARAYRLEGIVAKIADLDARPEIDEDDLDKNMRKADREKIARDRRNERAPLQAAVDEAVAELEEWDRENPAPEPADEIRMTQEEVGETLARLRPETDVANQSSEERAPEAENTGTAPETGAPSSSPEQADAAADAGDSPRAANGGDNGSGEPPVDAPNTGGADDDGSEASDQGAEKPSGEPDTTTENTPEPNTIVLSPDEVSAQLDAVRPEGSKAPSSMTEQEIRDEMVELMGREMAEGALSGVDRTRMAVLEAEEARRAGRTPKTEPKPKPQPQEPGGLFDVDQPATSATPLVDPENPLDVPDDEFGTPDMFAAAEGRDTSGLRPVQMRNAADLKAGDRYTDADGRTHTVAETPVRTGRGRTRIVTDDGAERFYHADAELRLRYPDEEIPENEEERSQPAVTDDSTTAAPESVAAPDDNPADETPQTDPTTAQTDVNRTDRMASMVERALDIAGGDTLPEIRDLADAMDRADAADDPAEDLRDVAERLDSLAERYEMAGPKGERAADLFRRAARIARGENNPDNPQGEGGEEQRRQDGQDSPDQGDGNGETDSSAEALSTDEGAGSPDAPGSEDSTEDDPQEQQREKEDQERRRRRRRRGTGGNGGPGGGGGPGGPGTPGAPPLGLPLGDGSPASATDGGRGRAGGREGNGRSGAVAPLRSVDEVRDAWRRGAGLTPAEDTPERRAVLAQAADRDGLVLSPAGGIVAWPEPQADGMTLWRFAQARNGTNLPGLTLVTDDPEEARALAARFEDISAADGQRFDWSRPWGPSTVGQWRDGEGRNLQRALHAVRDDFEQQRATGGQQATVGQGPDPQDRPAAPAPVPGLAALPDDLTALSQEDLDAAWSTDLSSEDQMRVMVEMDRRDEVDQRLREAIPDTPPATPEEAERRGMAMDAALGFADTDVVRPRRTREERLRAEFNDIDEARYLAALAATNGYFFKRKYADSPLDERELFSGGSMSAFGRWHEYASEELQDWFKANGGRLTFNEFKKRRRDEDRRGREEYEEETRLRDEESAPLPIGTDSPDPIVTDTDAEAGTEPDAGVIALRARAEAADRYRDLEDAVRGTDDEDLGALAEEWGNAEAAIADGDLQAGVQHLKDAHWIARRRAMRMRNDPQKQNVRDALEAFSVAAHNAAARTGVTPRENERWTTYGELQEGDVIRSPWYDRAEVITEAPSSATGREAFYATQNLDDLGGSRLGNPADHLVLVDEDPKAVRKARRIIAERRRYLPASHTSQDNAPAAARTAPDEPTSQADAPSSGDRSVDEPSNSDTAMAISSAAAELVAPEGLALGDQVRATGRSNRGTGVTREGTLLAEPQASTGRANGESTPVWRLYVGAEGEQPSLRNQVNVPRDGQVERLSQAAAPLTRSDTATPRRAAAAEPSTPPQPINGQPAHWARVEDLVPGDMVRMEGTTKKGRATTRTGCVYNAPVRVEVTRRGRTQYEWRTWVTEHADGTGASGNVFTPLNASAGRAQTPDNTVPGSPASGAESDVLTGNLPDVIPTDRDGRGLFPGSSVTGTRAREGTVTGASDSTVSVRWADGDTETGLAPTSLTVTGGERPAGWTTTGQRVTPGHVVTDDNGAILGPVDTVDGDRITVSTGEGTVTRSAGDLRVVGEVRDEEAAAPVTSIDTRTAADLTEGNVVVLDLDGTLTTVEVRDVQRDGDRVTLDYVDTTTGELGELELDAAAVVHRAQGPDGALDLDASDAPDPDDELIVHEPAPAVDPVTGPTIDSELSPADRDVIDDHASGPDDDPDARQAAIRISTDLPVTAEQAKALASQLRASADPSTTEGRAALRAADHLDQAAGSTPPAGLDRPRPSNAAQLGEGDIVAMPDERRGDQVGVFRVIDTEDGPGGVRRLLLEDENRQWRRRIVHGALPVWQLPEPRAAIVTPPEADANESTAAPADTVAPVARVRPGSLRAGDVIDAPVSRTGYQFNGHRRLTIITPPQRQGWWMALTGVDDQGNVHDFGLHSGRDVNVYERNRPTPVLPTAGAPRDPNPAPQSAVDRIVTDHARAVATRIIEEAVAGTEQPGDIHALREQIAQRLTAEALREARQAARQEAIDALNAAGITGRDRAAAMQALKQTRQNAHTATVRAALRTINDLEPLPDESPEDLAERAADLLRLIPDQIGRPAQGSSAASDRDIARTVAGHADEAMTAVLEQLQASGLDAGDAEMVARLLAGQLSGSRQAAARRIARRIAGASPAAGRQPGLLASIVALLLRLGRRLVELVKAAARKIAEMWRNSRDRLARLRAFLRRLASRVKHWPESRRLARLQAALDLPANDGESLAARITHWATLMPEAGRFGQTSQRVTWWRPTTWSQLAAGRLPGRSDRVQWAPDRAADGGPGLTALRHMAALRAAGSDVDQDVTRRLAAALGDDFGADPHQALQHADDYVAATERRLFNLQAARSGATIQDPDVEVEITAARLEASTARREWENLRARYAAAVPDAVAAALAEIRDIGPQGDAGIVFSPDSTPDAERAVRGVQRLLPRAWLSVPAGRRLTAVDGDVGRYEPERQRATIADLADDGLGTAGHALAQHFARHVEDLDAAQRVFWFTRTHTGRPGARRMSESALGRLLARWRQQTQPATGDSLARSVQAMFSGDWYLDDDLRAFLLGLLATR